MSAGQSILVGEVSWYDLLDLCSFTSCRRRHLASCSRRKSDIVDHMGALSWCKQVRISG